MINKHTVTDVRFTAASQRERATGLLGWVRFSMGGLIIDGATARRTRDGELRLSWPEHRDGRGRGHPIVRPQDDRTRQLLEAAVFHALGIEEATP